METKHNIRLTSAEMGELWTSYISDNMASKVLPFFIKYCEDVQIKEVLQNALSKCMKHLADISQIFTSVKFPIPAGFTDQDVNMNAPRLFSDTYYLEYLRNMTKFGIAANGIALTLVARNDVVQYFASSLQDAKEMHIKVTNLMLEKGIYVRPPYLSVPEKIDFVEKQGFLTGFFGERRPLTGVEIAHLFLNMTNSINGKALLMGFSRVAQSKVLREYFDRGVDIAKKHIEVMQTILNEEDLPGPMTHDTDVMDSQIPPFSDKLMLFQANQISVAGIGNYGGSLSVSFRRDLVTQYTRLLSEVMKYSEDGINLSINNGWFEQPPQADNHKELVHNR